MDDFKILDVDDDENINITDGVKLIPGNYFSRIEDDEIIITVKFQ